MWPRVIVVCVQLQVVEAAVALHGWIRTAIRRSKLH